MTTTTTAAPAKQVPPATDFVASIIRTYVPLLAGLILGWVAMLHLPFKVVGLSQGLVESVLEFAIAAAWYFVVRALETRWPKLGILLGVPTPPTYSGPALTTLSVAGNGSALSDETAAAIDAATSAAAALKSTSPATPAPTPATTPATATVPPAGESGTSTPPATAAPAQTAATAAASPAVESIPIVVDSASSAPTGS